MPTPGPAVPCGTHCAGCCDVAAVFDELWRVREMSPSDIGDIHRIEKVSYPYPWTRGIFADCLRVGYCCRVLHVGQELAGYGIMSVAAGEAHLLNLCIAEAHRGRGAAVRLLDHLVLEARMRQATRLFLEVRPSNEAARKLYENHDFRVIGRRPGYYPDDDGREDALVMVRRLRPVLSTNPE